jgi:hypothetical protein
MSRRLTNEEKRNINIAMVNGKSRDIVLYQSPRFNGTKKAKDTRTNAVNSMNAIGDVAHLLAFGLTMGGLMHAAVRSGNQEANWNSVVANAKDRARSNHLFIAENAPCTQFAVLGGKYITLYEKGEYKSRIINFSDVVQISVGPKGLTFITDNKEKGNIYNAYIIHSNVMGLEKMALYSVENCLR